jgi:hypothetical protein
MLNFVHSFRVHRDKVLAALTFYDCTYNWNIKTCLDRFTFLIKSKFIFKLLLLIVDISQHLVSAYKKGDTLLVNNICQ